MGYRDLKENGLCRLLKKNEGYVMIKKLFAPDTGELVGEEEIAIDREALLEEKEKLLQRLADIEALLADLKRAKPAKEEMPYAVDTLEPGAV